MANDFVGWAVRGFRSACDAVKFQLSRLAVTKMSEQLQLAGLKRHMKFHVPETEKEVKSSRSLLEVLAVGGKEDCACKSDLHQWSSKPSIGFTEDPFSIIPLGPWQRPGYYDVVFSKTWLVAPEFCRQGVSASLL